MFAAAPTGGKALESGKTKIAKRMIEVLEFFANGHDRATVMDIVRHYGRPQSSTSELLSALVQLGLLYKDPQARTYSPTPRLAALGGASQPSVIANGQLFRFMDQLAQSTRLTVLLCGSVGTHAQVFRISQGQRKGVGIGCGDSVLLSDSALGLLLLSAQGQERAGRMLWRLNAEAPPERRFSLATHGQQVAACAAAGHVTGELGFCPRTRVTAVLLPDTLAGRPLVLGVCHSDKTAIDSGALVATLSHGIARCNAGEDGCGSSLVRSIALQ
ncbi:MAG: helix-turn-helix domain-containing protein [Sphingomonadales bacterium]|nr:helix-turn-helix domain-containing protein [Sphingomonadales bacterium]